MKNLLYIVLLMVMAQGLTAAPAKSWTYAYNDTGARKQVVEDGELTDDTINIAGQVISRTGLPENSYAYDNDGNLESDPNWDYIFNEANQLVRMDNKEAVGYSVAFSYDFSGRRYEKSVLLEDVLTERTTYVYDGQRVIAEIDSLEEAVEDHELERTYTHGLYVDELLAYTDHVDDLNSETYYVTTDRQFSTRSVVDSLGDVIEERNYSPMGKDLNGVAESSDLAYGFTGRRYDAESDLYYFRARYYSTDLGSFISRDPLMYVDGMNVYSGYFARQFTVDPSGTNVGIISVTEDDHGDGAKKIELESQLREKYGKRAEVQAIWSLIQAIWDLKFVRKYVGKTKSEQEFQNLNPFWNGKKFKGKKEEYLKKIDHELKSEAILITSGGLPQLKSSLSSFKSKKFDKVIIIYHGTKSDKALLNGTEISQSAVKKALQGYVNETLNYLQYASCHTNAEKLPEVLTFEPGGFHLLNKKGVCYKVSANEITEKHLANDGKKTYVIAKEKVIYPEE